MVAARPNPAGAPERLAGRCVAAGARSRELLEKLLGITEAGGRYRLRAVAWMDHALEAGVTVDDGEVVIRIERRAARLEFEG